MHKNTLSASHLDSWKALFSTDMNLCCTKLRMNVTVPEVGTKIALTRAFVTENKK